MTELKDLGLQSLKLNINDSIIEPIFAKEGDKKSRGLNIQLLKNNQEFDTTGITMKMRARPKDKEVYEMDVSEIDITKGMYQIIYPSVILQEGIVQAELILYKNDAIISSKKFKIHVEGGLVTDAAIEGHDAYPLFEKLLDAANKIDDLSEEQRIKNEDLRETNEDQRIENEVIRQSQEQQRQESMTDIENRFTNLTTSQQQDSEVMNARTSTIKNKTFNSLNDRLEEAEKDINKAEQNAKQYTNTEIEKINNKIDKPLYSTPVETYNNVIHLPENTTNGQVSGNIKGETTTNLLGKGFADLNLWGAKDFEYIGNGYAKIESDVDTYKNAAIGNGLTALKPNTQYTVWVEVIKNTLTKHFIVSSIHNHDPFTSDSTIEAGFVGKKSILLTTKEDISNTNDLRMFARPDEGEIVFRIMVLEGVYSSEEVNYIEDTKSTIAAMKIKSVGKNLFDGKLEKGFINTNNGENMPHLDRTRSKNYIRVKKGEVYSISEHKYINNINIYFYDLNRDYVKAIYVGNTLVFACGLDGYIRFTISDTGGDTNIEVQLEKCDAVTEYETYKESTAYITAKKDDKIVNLNSLPNGVTDKIDLDKGELIKWTNTIKLKDIDGWVFYQSNSDNIGIQAPNFKFESKNGLLFNNGVRYSFNFNGVDAYEYYYGRAFGVVNIPNSESGWKVGYEPTPQEIKEYLNKNNHILIYQLAEPEIIPIEVEGELQGYENGTVYFTPYIKDKFIVDNTKTITLQYPIKAIDKLLKLDTANAAWIEVEGTLSEDGQTITVSEEGTYKVYGEIQEGYSTEGLKRIVTNINLNAQINSNTTAIQKINNKIYTDADLFTAMLLQQEVRITALEGGMTV